MVISAGTGNLGDHRPGGNGLARNGLAGNGQAGSRLIAASVARTKNASTAAAARVRSQEPDFDCVASAIRSFFRHEYAEHLHGTDDVPSRLSTFSGKGVGHYQTAGDGRADWSNGFKKYIFERTENGSFSALEFSMAQFNGAMNTLKMHSPRWYEATMLYDVQATPIAQVAQKLKVTPASIHRYRKSTILFLYPIFLGCDNRSPRRLHVTYRPLSYDPSTHNASTLR